MIDCTAACLYFLGMGNPHEGKEQGSKHFDPLSLVAGKLLFVDHGKDMAAWTQTGFALRKLENAPIDGAFDDVPTSGWSARWAKVRRRFSKKS